MSSPIHLRRIGPLGVALPPSRIRLPCRPPPQAAPVDLGTAGSFVVLGGSTVTNTGPSVLNGDLGVSPGTALVGFGLPAVVNGATHANDGVAATGAARPHHRLQRRRRAARAPATTSRAPTSASRTLTPGAYRYTTSAQLTGPLTLDAEGDPNAQFVFEIGSTLTTASASSVLLVNGASPCNVYWQVGSSATLGTGTAFQGNVMALTSHLAEQRRHACSGGLLARNGAVTPGQQRAQPLAVRRTAAPTPPPRRRPTGPGGGTGRPAPPGAGRRARTPEPERPGWTDAA